MRFILPEMAIVPVDATVQPVTCTLRSRQAIAPVTVIVPGVPLRLVMNTLSVAVGIAAPEAPPSDRDHLVVPPVVQVPAPPTQYLSVTTNHHSRWLGKRRW